MQQSPNFVRLAKKAPYDPYYCARREKTPPCDLDGVQKNPVTGKIFKDTFIVNVLNKDIYFNIGTYPYRNGSKAIIYAKLVGVYSEKNNAVDFVVMEKAFKKEIERIVKS